MTYDGRPFLITGAGGRVGSTGAHVARDLLASGIHVRAVVRQDDDRAQALRAMGAHVVVGDLLDLHFVRDAFSEVKRAYFTCGVVPKYTEIAANIAVAAREAALDVLINMSQMTAEAGASSPQTRQHWLSEQIFEWAALPVVQMRCGLFLEDIGMIAMRSINRDDTITLPWGEGIVSLISGPDIARCVAEILRSPAVHVGQAYLLTGPDPSISGHGMAAELSAALARNITYRMISPEEWGMRAKGAGLHEHLIDHLVQIGAKMGENRYARVTDHVLRITGRKPMTLTEYAAAYPAFFAKLGGVEVARSRAV